MPTTTHSFFTERLPAFLLSSKNPPPTAGSFLFDVQGEGGGCWTIDLRSTTPHCRAGAADNTDCTITLDNNDLTAVLRREENLEELYYQQRVKVTGDLTVAAGLLRLFSDATSPETQPALSELLAPYPVPAFMEHHWPGQYLVIPSDTRRIDTLQSMAPVASLDALLARWPGMVRVFPPGKADELSPHVTTDAAEELYARGFTLVFESVDLQFPELRRWLEAVHADLALPPTVWSRCMIYATPPGSGFNPHFDENANFAFQVLGSKRWRIAENTSVQQPTVGHRLGGGIDPELAAAASAPMPLEMPETSVELTLEPGSLLFLPRGWHHTTTAVEPSLSLNFTFDQPCWADIVTSVLRASLIQQTEWRELASGVGSKNQARATSARTRAAAMLQRVATELHNVDLDETLARLRPPSRGGDLIDLRRNWVAALSHLGKSRAHPTVPAGSGAVESDSPVGRLLYERLALGFENPSGVTGVCQFEIDGAGSGAFHLVVSGSEFRYVDGRADQPSAWVKMSAEVARGLAEGTNVDFRDQLNFESIVVDGDPALLGMLAQMTKLPNPDAGNRFALAEARARDLPCITEPLRLKGATAAQVSEALEKGIPLILEAGLVEWQEPLTWDFGTLRRRFPNIPVKSTLGLTTLAQFLDELERHHGTESPPYTIGSTMPEALRPFFPPPLLAPESFGPAQLWMGSGPGKISTLLHRDSGDAFLGQLIGRKQFKLYSPDQTPFMYVYRSYNRDQPCWVNPWEPDFARFPLFRNANAVEFTLHPGELLVIPRGWYHTVLALDVTMSVGFHREPVTDFGRVISTEDAGVAASAKRH